MSKLFGRVGTSAMKYSFELTVDSLHMSIPLTTPMCVKWTRGPRTATNQPVSGVNGEYTWPSGKPMTIIATMYMKKHAFQEKKSKITVKQLLGKDLKSVGQVEIDLAEFCGEGETTKNITLKLQKCSDKKAFLMCTVRSRWLKQMDGNDDTASQISGASSVDARSESAMPGARDVANLDDLDGMDDAHEEDIPEGDETAPTPKSTKPDSRRGSGSATVASASATTATSTPSVDSTALQREIDTLRAKVAELTTAVNAERGGAAKASALQAQLTEAEQATAALAREKAELEQEADSQLVALRSELKTTQAELEGARQDKVAAQRHADTQQEQMAAEVQKLKTRLEEQHVAGAAAAAARFASTATSPTASTAAAAAATDATARLSASFDAERATLERQLKEARADLAQATQLTHDAFARMQQLESKLAQANTEHGKELQEKEREIARLETTVRERDTLVAQSQEEGRTSQQQLIDLRRGSKELKNELASLQASYVAEVARREMLQGQLEASEAALQEGKTSSKKAERQWEEQTKAAIKDAQAKERERVEKEMREKSSTLASPAASKPAPSPTSSSSIAELTATISGLQKKVDEYALRVVSAEEDRARLEGDVQTLEHQVSKAKEDELVMLEERYEEKYKANKLLKEKENEVDELQRASRDSVREAREAKALVEKREKEAKELRKSLEAAEQTIETTSAKWTKGQDEWKRTKALLDQASGRVRELEDQQKSLDERVQTTETRCAELQEEVERAVKKRADVEAECERERDEWKAKEKEQAAQLELERERAKTAAAAAVEAGKAQQASSSDDAAIAVSADASDRAAAEAVAADLLYTQGLVLKRNQDIADLEQVVRDLKARVRALEDVDDRLASLQQRSKDAEATAAKKWADLAKEKMQLEEELTLLREKREKDRNKLAEREDREKEQRFHAQQAASESASQLSALTVELDARNAKIDELQEQLATKQSKVSEQQDKLNSATRIHETLTREHAEAREQLAIVSGKVDQAEARMREALARLDETKRTSGEKVDQLERQLAEVQARRMVFDQLQGEAAEALKKDKPAAALAEGLQLKIQFYEDQLQDADESMAMAKASWLASSGVLVAQVDAAERQVAQLQQDLHESRESKGLDASKVLQLETKLKKVEKDKSKLSELMSRFEVELVEKKVALTASLDQLATCEYEAERLRGQLAKQMKACEVHTAELAKYKP